MATSSRKTLAAIRARLAELESEKAELEQLLANYAYPILTLPNEITGLIFTHYVPTYPECPRFSGSGSPTTLSQVCHSWRQIALSMSSLWCAIQYGEFTQAAAVSSWLSRSGDRLLSFQDYYDDTPAEDVRDLILGCSVRWEHIQLGDGMNLDHSLLGGGTPNLRHLELHVDTIKTRNLFRDAPNLRTAIIWDTFHCPRGLLPWSQLTGLILICLTVEQTAMIVSQTPNLRYCELMLEGEYPTVPAPPDISLPHLETLVLSKYSDFESGDPMPGEFLLDLVTPVLRHLRITDPMLRPDPAVCLLAIRA
ncbi:F-box domain-containing protein [Mycena chlorophos]|uniref:F-box domain-containing protein n=1 Tax=Mycena chlorophos TaxID=658473 RepID=A0A8H6SVP2_MYCCL|nr:F-box domain-containing protein [Mycena chlorophos]